MRKDSDMLKEYDFSKGIQGKYEKNTVKVQMLWLLIQMLQSFSLTTTL